MNLFVLIAENGGTSGRFLEDVTPLVPQDKIEVLNGSLALAERLRKPRDPFCAVLVLGPSHEDLRRIISLRDFLKDARMLLVLGDESEETISLAHRVLPTYISDLDESTSGVVSVLKQLMKDARVHQRDC
ncbi:MAG: hypothetical protein ACXWFO_00620 [Candidatus Aminicenantales bacterium]